MDIKTFKRIEGIVNRGNLKRTWGLVLFGSGLLFLLGVLGNLTTGESSIEAIAAPIFWMLLGAALIWSWSSDQKLLSEASPAVLNEIERIKGSSNGKTESVKTKKTTTEQKSTASSESSKVGKPILKESIGLREVTIFANGYIQITKGEGVYFGKGKNDNNMSAPEKLIAITGNTTAKMASVGLLVIVTEKGTYKLSTTDIPAGPAYSRGLKASWAHTSSQVATLEALVAVGNTVIKS